MKNISKKSNDDIIVSWYGSKFNLIVESIIVGVLTGFVVVAFRSLIGLLGGKVLNIYKVALLKWWIIPIMVVVFIILGCIIGIMSKNHPMIGGSGIPQVEGVILSKLKMNWLKVVVEKFVGGVLAIGAGLSLGREGPSVQLGAAIGQGVSRLFKGVNIEEKHLITSGASAGLAAAFNAPLAGTIFALEEVHKNFSPLILATSFLSALSADFITSELLGAQPIFNFSHIYSIPLRYYFYIVLFGIIIGVTGAAFNIVLLKTQDLYGKQKIIPQKYKAVVPLLVSIVFGLFLPQVLGGGNSLILDLSNVHFTMTLIFIMLICKFFFTMICYGSGVPGGIFLPLLTIGALIGSFYGQFFTLFLHVNSYYVNNFIIMGMTGYFTAVVRSPITGIILITEMTGSFNHFLSLSIVSIIAYLVADKLGTGPIYESLLDKFLINNAGMEIRQNEQDEKTIIQVPVCLGSYLDGKVLKEIDWPCYCLIVEIKRGCHKIIPNGETIIYAGDYLTVLTDESTAGRLNDLLNEMSQSQRKI